MGKFVLEIGLVAGQESLRKKGQNKMKFNDEIIEAIKAGKIVWFKSKNISEWYEKKSSSPITLNQLIEGEWSLENEMEKEKPNPCSDCESICCKCFVLPRSPRELEEMAGPDAEFARKHFTHLGEFAYNPVFPQRITERKMLMNYYSCRKLGSDGKCTDYENRPPLCKNYGVEYSPDKDCLLYPAWCEKNDPNPKLEPVPQDHNQSRYFQGIKLCVRRGVIFIRTMFA